MSMEGLTEGRIVHFVLAEGEHRPAIVVKRWSENCANLQVFVDGTNDARFDVPLEALKTGVMWATSVVHDPEGKQVRSMHFPERA